MIVLKANGSILVRVGQTENVQFRHTDIDIGLEPGRKDRDCFAALQSASEAMTAMSSEM